MYIKNMLNTITQKYTIKDTQFHDVAQTLPADTFKAIMLECYAIDAKMTAVSSDEACHNGTCAHHHNYDYLK